MSEKEKLDWGASLKPGDIVNDCRYLNIKIKEIKARSNEEFGIYDYDIVTEDGQGCSLMGCCEKPLTDEKIKWFLLNTPAIEDPEEAVRWVMEHPNHNHIGKQ